LCVAAGAGATDVMEGMSLQDIACSRNAWDLLDALPSDRILPDGLKKGATKGVRQAFQQKL
jgi:hypothetical protein